MGRKKGAQKASDEVDESPAAAAQAYWAALAQQAAQSQAALLPKPKKDNTLHVKIQELRDHYGLEEAQTRELDAVMKTRTETFDEDIKALFQQLRKAYNPNGMLKKLICDLQGGAFTTNHIPLPPPGKDRLSRSRSRGRKDDGGGRDRISAMFGGGSKGSDDRKK